MVISGQVVAFVLHRSPVDVPAHYEVLLSGEPRRAVLLTFERDRGKHFAVENPGSNCDAKFNGRRQMSPCQISTMLCTGGVTTGAVS